MSGTEFLAGIIRRVFRTAAKDAALGRTLEGIADAVEQITGERPEISMPPAVAAIAEEVPDVTRGAIAPAIANGRTRKTVRR